MDLNFIFDHQDIKRDRRHTIQSSWKGSIGNALLGFLTQTLNTKPTLKQSQQAIRTNMKKINQLVDKVQQHMQLKIQSQQEQLIQIFKQQVEDMKELTKKVIQKLNNKLQERNRDDEIFHINNQLDYFKVQAYKLFQDNTKLRLENARLRNTIKQNKVQNQANNLTMIKLKRKWIKSRQILQDSNRRIHCKSNLQIYNSKQLKHISQNDLDKQSNKSIDKSFRLSKRRQLKLCKQPLKSNRYQQKQVQENRNSQYLQSSNAQSKIIIQNTSSAYIQNSSKNSLKNKQSLQIKHIGVQTDFIQNCSKEAYQKSLVLQGFTFNQSGLKHRNKIKNSLKVSSSIQRNNTDSQIQSLTNILNLSALSQYRQ